VNNRLWLPINLIGATIIRDLQAAPIEKLAEFSVAALAVGPAHDPRSTRPWRKTWTFSSLTLSMAWCWAGGSRARPKFGLSKFSHPRLFYEEGLDCRRKVC